MTRRMEEPRWHADAKRGVSFRVEGGIGETPGSGVTKCSAPGLFKLRHSFSYLSFTELPHQLQFACNPFQGLIPPQTSYHGGQAAHSPTTRIPSSQIHRYWPCRHDPLRMVSKYRPRLPRIIRRSSSSSRIHVARNGREYGGRERADD